MNVSSVSLAVVPAESRIDSVSLAAPQSATLAIAAMDRALEMVNGQRAQVGPLQNRFESVIANLQTTSESLTTSRSRIKDADFATQPGSRSDTAADRHDHAGAGQRAVAERAQPAALIHSRVTRDGLHHTIVRVRKSLDTSFPSANAAVKVLEELGIVIGDDRPEEESGLQLPALHRAVVAVIADWIVRVLSTSEALVRDIPDRYEGCVY